MSAIDLFRRPEFQQAMAQNTQNMNTWNQFTPEQYQQYLSDPKSNPFAGQYLYTNEARGLPGEGMWATPFDWKGYRGSESPGFLSDVARGTAEMAPGLAVMFGGPALGLAGTALAAGAGVGAGVAGGAAVGGTETGITAGAAGSGYGATGAGAALSGSSGSGTLLGGAGTDTLGGETLFPGESATSGPAGSLPGETVFPGESATSGPAGSAAADETGAFDMYGSNSGAPGGQPGTVFDYQSPASTYLQQAQDMAKQLGITPAAALQMVLKGIGRAAPAALGAVGAKQQQNSLEALANKYLDFGAPSRARYEASYAPGFTMANDPGYMDALEQSSKATLHGLSVNGNPAGSPNAWEKSLSDNYAKTAYPALQNFRNTNANAGGIASLQTSAPGFDTSAVNAGKGVFDAIGGGINDIFSPKPSLAQTLADYKRLLGSV